MKQILFRAVMAIVAMVSASVLQLMAQTDSKDPNDPGVIYIMNKEGGMRSFHEGEEWTVTFGCQDTLGQKYVNPVSINFCGGEFFDTLRVEIGAIDSLLMYQPEPEYQPGVIVITEEYLPYILEVDSLTTIHFSYDIKGTGLAVPRLGDHVVSDLTQEPFPMGFLGVVSEVYDRGSYIECICDGPWDNLKEFYQSCIKSESTQSDDALPRGRRRAARRELRLADDNDLDFSSWFKLVTLNGGLQFEDELSTNTSLSVKMGGNFAIYFKGQRDVAVMPDAETSDSRIGLHFGLDWTTVSVNATFEYKNFFPIPSVGIKEAIDKFPDWKTEVQVGLGLNLSGKAELDFSMPSYKAALHLNPGLDDILTFTHKWDLNNLHLTATLSGEFAFCLKLGGSMIKKGRTATDGIHKNEPIKAELDLRVDLFNLSGICTLLNLSPEYLSSSSPEEVMDHYKHLNEQNHLNMHFLKLTGLINVNFKYVSSLFNCDLLDVALDYKLPEDIWGHSMAVVSLKNSFFPRMVISKQQVSTDAQYNKYAFTVFSTPCSWFPFDAELWFWDRKQKEWIEKIPIGEVGGSWNVFSSNYDVLQSLVPRHYDVRKGDCIEVCPTLPVGFVYSAPGSVVVYGSYKIPAPDVDVHYNIVKFTPKIEAFALSDEKEGIHTFEVAIQVVETSKAWPKDAIDYQFKSVAEALSPSDFGREPLVMRLEPDTKYKCRVLLRSDGNDDCISYSDDVTFSTENPYYPKTMPVVSTDYTEATIKGVFSDVVSSGSKFGFMFKESHETDFRTKLVDLTPEQYLSKEYTYTLTNLNPCADYEYKAVLWVDIDGVEHPFEGEIKMFTTPNPYNVTTGESIPYYFGAYVKGSISQWALDDKNYLKDIYFVYRSVLTDKTDSVKVQKPYETTEFEAFLDGLTNDTYYDYWLTAEIIPRGSGDNRFFNGHTVRFRTLDAYTVTLLAPVEKDACTFKLHGETTSYVFEALDDCTNVEYSFVYSKNEEDIDVSNIDMSKVHKKKASRDGLDVRAEIGDLSYHTTYYYRLILKGTKPDGTEAIFKSNTGEFTTPDIFKPTEVTATMVSEGIEFKMLLDEKTYPYIESQEFVPVGKVRFAAKGASFNDSDRSNEVVMTLRHEDGAYYFQELAPHVFLEADYDYRGYVTVEGKTSYRNGRDAISVPTVKIEMGEVENVEDRVNMHGKITCSMPEHLQHYKDVLKCSFTYMPENITEDTSPYVQSADLDAETLEFSALDVYVPAGDEEALDYFVNAKVTVPADDVFTEERSWESDFTSFTAYYYDSGTIVWVAPRYLDAHGKWQRTEIPAHIKQLLKQRKAE